MFDVLHAYRGVDLCGAEAEVAEQLLNASEVAAAPEPGSCGAMLERVQAAIADIGFRVFVYRRWMQVLTSPFVPQVVAGALFAFELQKKLTTEVIEGHEANPIALAVNSDDSAAAVSSAGNRNFHSTESQ